MRARASVAALIVGVALLTVGCATREDWNEWLSHSSHFASGDHGFFSLKNNKDGSNPKVTRSDIDFAREQKWWGIYAVTVDPKQIMQN